MDETPAWFILISVNTLQHDLGQLASAHSELKRVTDLTNETEILQLQETKQADQIQNTSDGQVKHTVHSTQQLSDHKLNVILYGIDEQCLQTSRYERQQNDIKAVMS